MVHTIDKTTKKRENQTSAENFGFFSSSQKKNQEDLKKKVMSKTNDKYWLTAFKDQFANAQSFSSCVRYADVEGNGDNSLVIGTIDKKLKTFSGVKLIKEHQLLGVPVSVNALYLDESERGKKVQMCIAVATGAYVFVYVVF